MLNAAGSVKGAVLPEGEGASLIPMCSFLSLVNLSCLALYLKSSIATTAFVHWSTRRCFCPLASSFCMKQLREYGWSSALLLIFPTWRTSGLESSSSTACHARFHARSPQFFSSYPNPMKIKCGNCCATGLKLKDVSSILTKWVL